MSAGSAIGAEGGTTASHPDVGISARRTDVCTLASVRRVAAMLDLDSDGLAPGSPLPRGWHFFLLGGETRRSALRADGFPGFGVPMPDVGLPRLMLGGRTVTYDGDLAIGATIETRSRVASIARKQSAAGEMAIVTIRHEIGLVDRPAPAITEQQTYIMLGRAPSGGTTGRPLERAAGARTKIFVPDETLLFQYSALGFNSHRIHLDRDYARGVEGLPDLVVNGGLTTLLATEFLRRDLGLVPDQIRTRHTAALYCGRAMTLTAEEGDGHWKLRVLDHAGVLAVDMEASVR